MRLRRPSTTSLMAYILFFFSFCMVLGSVYSVMNIQVLKNWRLILPAGKIYAGQTIIIKSEYIKLRQVTGQASRYIDCDATTGTRLSYLINQKDANRAAGKGGTGVEITLPTDISNLPTLCDIRIVVKYRVVPFKDTTEINQTKDFTLYPKPGAGSSTLVPSAKRTTPSQTSGGSRSQSRGNVQSSSSNHSANVSPAQSDNPQPTQNPQPTAPSSIPIVTPVLNLVSGLLK